MRSTAGHTELLHTLLRWYPSIKGFPGLAPRRYPRNIYVEQHCVPHLHHIPTRSLDKRGEGGGTVAIMHPRLQHAAALDFGPDHVPWTALKGGLTGVGT